VDFDADKPGPSELLECPECGHRFRDPDVTELDQAGPVGHAGVQPGKELNGFLIQERIGFGGMGEVYKAVQLSLDRVVVVKVLPPAFAERPLFVRRFHEESTALSALNHPNIVTIYERGNVGKVYFFAMEYIDGVSLSEVPWDPGDVQQLLHVAKGTVSALSYAHERGVVHRDIKPANVMLSSRNEVKVTDFGLAALMAEGRREPQSGQERPQIRMGTPAYMSPEQKDDPQQVDGRTDIFSVGVLLYELITGERPQIPMQKPPSAVNELADPRLDKIVTLCLAERPDERYQTANALLEALQDFEEQLERAPRCPACEGLSPVQSEKCVHCGASLEELFDLCPECKHKNRRDVRECLHCGVDLEKGRTLISQKVAVMLDQADHLRLGGSYTEALQILKEVGEIEGRVFEKERQRAAGLRRATEEDREQAAQKAYEEAKRMLAEQRFREAIELFRQVPEDIRDTTDEVARARQLQARLAADRRSQATTNLLLIAIGLTLVIVLLLFAFL
jgi:hypothetical protein